MLNYKKLISISASEAGKVENPQWINVLNTGSWQTSYQGDFEVTNDHLIEMVLHFNENVRKGIPIDTDHDHKGSNGWVTRLEVRNATELWALVEWTSDGIQKLSEKIYKFLSPEFAPKYFDPETNQYVCDNVLIAAALTNFPLMKGLQSVVASESNENIIYLNEKTMEDEKPTTEPTDVVEDATVVEAGEKKSKKAEVEPEDEGKDVEKPEEDMKEEDDEEETADEKKKAVKKASEDSMEEEVDEIADAYAEAINNPFINQWYGYMIVGTYEDENGKGHIIVVADPDCDSASWSDLAHVKYYRVDFTEDEAAEKYIFSDPIECDVTFVPESKEVMAAEKYDNQVKTSKSEVTEEVAEVITEKVMNEKKPVLKLNPELMLELGKKGITKVKAGEDVAEIKEDGTVVIEEPKTEIKEEVAEKSTDESGETKIAVEGEVISISASEYAEFKQAKEELNTKIATETVTTLAFNEKSGVKMPLDAKDSVVSFYLKLNEGMKKEFETIMSRIPSNSIMFNEKGGDDGVEIDANTAYTEIGKKVNAILASEPKTDYTAALRRVRKDNPDLAKLANEARKLVKK